MMRTLLAIAWALAAPLEARATAAVEELHRIRPDVDLVAGFEPCPAPPAVYARLQDELMFGVGADGLLPGAAALAGVEPGSGVEGLLVAVRGEGALALTPSTVEGAALREPVRGRAFREVSDGRVAYGDLTLLSTRTSEQGVTAPLPPSLRDPPASRCAWALARPGWFRRDTTPSAEADVRGRSLLRSVDGITMMAVTADFASEVVVTLRVSAEDSEDAALLADALREFLATRRRNRDAPEAVRAAVERGTVQRQSEVVTMRLPLSAAALDRIRRNADSRALLRLRLEEAERERWQEVAAIVRALELQAGDSVADVGAGEGFFSVRLARAVGPAGRVSAVEISETAVAALSERATAASLGNVEAVLGIPDDPRLRAGSLDAALIVNAYHEMPFYEAVLAHLFESLKPGGRLVLVEPWSAERRDEARAAQVGDHLIAPELAERELRRAGFEIGSRRDDFIAGQRRQQWLIQARRPRTGAGGAAELEHSAVTGAAPRAASGLCESPRARSAWPSPARRRAVPSVQPGGPGHSGSSCR